MKGIIWGKTFFEAANQLNVILNNYLDLGIKPIKIFKEKNKYEIIFENLDVWQSFSVN